MTPGDDDRAALLLQFAGVVVGLKGQPGANETRAALFRKLREDDFLPDPLTHEAMLALAGREVAAPSLLAEEADVAAEHRLHVEVEQFAAEFFAIPVGLRVERWRRLAQTCSRQPRLTERLRALRPGLAINREAISDPSPVVFTLTEDLLTLFPLKPEVRAVESRERTRRLRSKPAWQDRQGSTALKHFRRRHPDIAALSSGYLTQLGPPRRINPAGPPRSGLIEMVPARVEPRKAPYVTIAGVIFAIMILAGLAGYAVRRPYSPFLDRIESADLASRLMPINPTVVPDQVDAPPILLPLALRDKIKREIRLELADLGITIDDLELERIVAGLRFHERPRVGGMASLVLRGDWNEKNHAYFVARLKDGLTAIDLGLDEKEIDELARKCFPKPVADPGPGRARRR